MRDAHQERTEQLADGSTSRSDQDQPDAECRAQHRKAQVQHVVPAARHRSVLVRDGGVGVITAVDVGRDAHACHRMSRLFTGGEVVHSHDRHGKSPHEHPLQKLDAGSGGHFVTIHNSFHCSAT